MVMSMVTRREITNILRVRYAFADRTLKGVILDEFVATAGYCRKYAICLLGKPPQAAPRLFFFAHGTAWDDLGGLQPHL